MNFDFQCARLLPNRVKRPEEPQSEVLSGTCVVVDGPQSIQFEMLS